MDVTKAAIGKFLAGKRLAVIGVSRNPKKYSRLLYQELLNHGYEAIPVHPVAETIDGRACFKSIRDISPPPDRAVILLPLDKTEQAVLDCAAAGVKDIWLHRHLAGGVSDVGAVRRAEENHLNLITGFCLIMFLPHPAFFHKLHGGAMKLIGRYPK